MKMNNDFLNFLVGTGQVDEFLVASGDTIENSDYQKLQELMDFVKKHKESGTINYVRKLEMLNSIANKPIEINI